MRHWKRLGEVSGSRDNNFNLIRMIAASSVLVSHSWPIVLGIGTEEPLKRELGYTLGTTSVLIFFAISGFFITQSFDRKSHFPEFLAARVLRIFPALAVVLLLTLLALGPVFTTLPLAAYFSDIKTYTYFISNISLIGLQFGLPGVFASNPFPTAINGSLWTLFYEVLCYCMVVLVGFTGLLRVGRFGFFLIIYAAVYLFAANYISGSTFVQHWVTLSLPFVLGMAFYVYRTHVVLHWGITALLAVAAWLAAGTPLYGATFAVLIAYSAFWLGHVAWFGRAAYNRLGDYSYGMYIFAFPIQQAIVALLPQIGVVELAITAFLATLACSLLSWRYVEAPALALRKTAATRLHAAVKRIPIRAG